MVDHNVFGHLMCFPYLITSMVHNHVYYNVNEDILITLYFCACSWNIKLHNVKLRMVNKTFQIPLEQCTMQVMKDMMHASINSTNKSRFCDE